MLGAPGSGKTLTLVELVADRVLQHGLAPEQVLVLAPNRLAATRLRDRLAVRLGVPSAGPIARTANSVAFQVVRAASARPVTLLTGTPAGVGKMGMGEVIRGVLPFMAMQFAVMFLLVFFPSLVTVPARWLAG